MTDGTNTDVVALATGLTVAWLGNPNTRTSAQDVPAFLQSMHGALSALTGPVAAPVPQDAQEFTRAVSVRRSLASPDHIISMIDGKPYRTLKRHLSSNGLTPEEYRKRYRLKPDYPMVAPAYSEARRDTAKRTGLGRKPAAVVQEAAATVAKKTRKGGKAALAAAKAALGTAE